MNTPATSIDQYIGGFPPEIQTLLLQMRATIRRAAPEATEVIKYGMPTFVLKGNLVHFAACKSHIGFYPVASGIATFRNECSAYKSSKGAVHFPLDRPLPIELIQEIVKFRVAENQQIANSKKK